VKLDPKAPPERLVPWVSQVLLDHLETMVQLDLQVVKEPTVKLACKAKPDKRVPPGLPDPLVRLDRKVLLERRDLKDMLVLLVPQDQQERMAQQGKLELKVRQDLLDPQVQQEKMVPLALRVQTGPPEKVALLVLQDP